MSGSINTIVGCPFSKCDDHGICQSTICQILLQIAVRLLVIASPPTCINSAGMLSTPADFPFFKDLTLLVGQSSTAAFPLVWLLYNSAQYSVNQLLHYLNYCIIIFFLIFAGIICALAPCTALPTLYNNIQFIFIIIIIIIIIIVYLLSTALLLVNAKQIITLTKSQVGIS